MKTNKIDQSLSGTASNILSEKLLKRVFLYCAPIVLLFGAVALSSCSHFSRSSTVDFSNGKSVVTGIEQRLIIASPKANSEGRLVICAEPSPDALSAAAAQLSLASDRMSENNVALSAAQQQTAVFVGLRTQSIQLLRDSLYRLCEGYMSGALTTPQYEVLMRRHQRYMVALLAIEQLTSAARSGPGPIVASASIKTSENITAVLTDAVAREADSVKTATSAVQAQNRLLEEEDDEEKKKPLAAKLEELEGQLLEAQKRHKKAEDALEDVTSPPSTSASGESNEESTSPSVSVSNTVATVVEKIALKVLDTDDAGQLCFNLFKNAQHEQVSVNDSLDKFCSTVFTSGIPIMNFPIEDEQ